LDRAFTREAGTREAGTQEAGTQEAGTSRRRLDGYLEFSDVTFGYNPLARPVLKNV